MCTFSASFPSLYYSGLQGTRASSLASGIFPSSPGAKKMHTSFQTPFVDLTRGPRRSCSPTDIFTRRSLQIPSAFTRQGVICLSAKV